LIEFSWNKLVRGDSKGPADGTQSEKVGKPLVVAPFAQRYLWKPAVPGEEALLHICVEASFDCAIKASDQ